MVLKPVCTLQCPFSSSNPGFGSVFCKCSPHLQKLGSLYHLKLVALETGYNFFQLHSKSCWTPRQTSKAALFTSFPRLMNSPQESQIIFLFLTHSARPTPGGAFDWPENADALKYLSQKEAGIGNLTQVRKIPDNICLSIRRGHGRDL